MLTFPALLAMQPLFAQFPEGLLLLLVPFAALPVKRCLVLGPLSWVCVFLGFFACCQFDSHLAIYLSLPFQAGNCIMQTTASIAVDGLFRTSRFRCTAQAALPFAQGTGLLLGSVIAGALVSARPTPRERPVGIRCGDRIRGGGGRHGIGGGRDGFAAAGTIPGG